MRKLDASAHIFPRSFWDRMRMRVGRLPDIGEHSSGLPLFTNLDQRFRLMDLFDDYAQILSLSGPALESLFSHDMAIDMARHANDGLADLTVRHPYRFPGFFASLPLSDPDAALAEIYRAVKDLGALGVQIQTDTGGRSMDPLEHAQIFRACYGLDIPLYLRPAQGAERQVAALHSKLVLSGLMDELPGIKIVTNHMGAFTQFAQGRGGTTSRDKLKRPHAEYFKDFYADTSLCAAHEATERGLAYHPRDRIVFASHLSLDSDLAATRTRDIIRLIESLHIDTEWKQDIFWRNATKILPSDHRTNASLRRLA